MGVPAVVEQCVTQARQDYRVAQPHPPLRVLDSERETVWRKLDHLLYLPVLHLTRPADLYAYQGAGLAVLYGYTYRYQTVEHFLGEVTRLQLGYPLAQALAGCYGRAWYPGATPLFIFTDWHIKPHWTQPPAHAGHVTMWGRVMPGTKQLLINGAEGHLLAGLNYAIDTHLSRVLVDLEEELTTWLERPIAYTIVDGEGNGLPLGERYAAAQRAYITVLPRHGDHSLAAFVVLGEWERVVDAPEREAVYAQWQAPQKAPADPRQLVLLRPVGTRDPTRVYAGCLPPHLSAGQIPAQFRQRWMCQERRIRQMVNGANLNANFGYTYQEVPNRTAQRQWDAAQERVEVLERAVAQEEAALTQLQRKLAQLRANYAGAQEELARDIHRYQRELARRQAAAQPTQRWQRGCARCQQQLVERTTCFQRQHRRLLERVRRRRRRRTALLQKLAERHALRDAIDTATLCRERDLEKDQFMLDLQVLLTSQHDWARAHYFAPQWQQLELDTATEMIYRKSGRVTWGRDTIEVLLDSYRRYPDQQQAMEETCRRFNAAQVRWRDGRLLCIRVAQNS
jgi:hypothetical protein